ncbi:uncharacterized protein [Nicotiana tomentosiformis]|uniref:uncharacterized protein n=1 Tax=Nicotiana tomentosiformis TaxID=4098 RepID=UPI00388CC547
MLRKDAATSWTEECQKAFDKIKEYLSKPYMLVPPEPGRPLLLYLSVLDGAFGCVLGQHDETERKKQAIYYLSMTFTPYEADSDLLVHQVLGKWATKNTKILPYLHYVQELIKRFTKIEFKHVPRIQNELVDAVATLSSMIQHPDKNFIDLILIGIDKQPTYCAYVEEEIDRNPWFHDIKEYLEKGEYPESVTHTQKCTLRRLANHFFQNGGILYRRTPDLGLLRCVVTKEASRLLEEIHAGTCVPPHEWFHFGQENIKSMIHADMTRVPPNEVNATSSPWPFSAWGMDVIGPIEHAASNGHRFILVAIDYFTKWVEAASYKAVTKKVVADFVRDRIVC